MTITHKFWRSAAPFSYGAIGLAPVTLVCFQIHAGLAAAALLYLMIVVLVSLKGSFVSSAVFSMFAIGCLDYFFTTPLFTFGMNDSPKLHRDQYFLDSLLDHYPPSLESEQAGRRCALQRGLQSD